MEIYADELTLFSGSAAFVVAGKAHTSDGWTRKTKTLDIDVSSGAANENGERVG